MTLLYQNASSCCIFLPNGLCLSCHYEVECTSEWLLGRDVSYWHKLTFQQKLIITFSVLKCFLVVICRHSVIVPENGIWKYLSDLFCLVKRVNKCCLLWCSMLQLPPCSCLPQHAIKSCLHLYYFTVVFINSSRSNLLRYVYQKTWFTHFMPCSMRRGLFSVKMSNLRRNEIHYYCVIENSSMLSTKTTLRVHFF